MSPRVRSSFSSLELRLFVPLAATLCVVLLVHAVVGFRATKSQFSRLVSAEVERSSALIKGATHDGMLLNQLDQLQLTLERLAEAPEVASVRVYNTGGKIVLSSRPEERGKMLSVRSETCLACHCDLGEGTALGDEHRLVSLDEGGQQVQRRVTVIRNEQGCSAAECHNHSGAQTVLGVLDVGMSMEPFGSVIRASQRGLAWTTLLLMLVSGGVSALFIRRVIHRPVQRLEAGTRRIAAGDLDTPIEVRGDDEMARLASAFNSMMDDLRTARAEITLWSHTLEEKVESKSRDLKLAERQVLHMETMASLGKLSATVAHELNNPLSGVLTYARLIRRELNQQALDPAVHAELDKYLGLVDRECSRCGAIVHNLLAFARRRGAQMAPVDLNGVVERSLMLVRHHTEMRNIRLVSLPLEGDATITADAGQIQQALLALLMNAIEAMPNAEGAEHALTVRLGAEADGVLIEVCDTGVGIAEDALPHIFEPFFSTKGGESGVGLGLAVVYGIVNRHGGSVEVVSEVGRGTTFKLRLPRTPEPGEDETGARAAEGGRAAT